MPKIYKEKLPRGGFFCVPWRGLCGVCGGQKSREKRRLTCLPVR